MISNGEAMTKKQEQDCNYAVGVTKSEYDEDLVRILKMPPTTSTKPCTICKEPVSFIHEWNWKTHKPLCMKCAIKISKKEDVGVAIPHEVEQNVKKITGMSDYQFELMTADIVKQLTSPTRPKGTGFELHKKK